MPDALHAERKRPRATPAVLLLDIEGTTTPISFVKEKLFPFAREKVRSFISGLSESEFDPILEAFKAQCLQDHHLFTPERAREEVIDLTEKWIDEDRKVTALKDLQGLMWRQGYEEGQLKGVMYDDAPIAMQSFASRRGRVAIFSSGSREAQRLIFKYSTHGDLTEHISAYFDPKIVQATKQESKAYTEIALCLGIEPSEGLFCTDILKEAQAAVAAGWSAALLLREGNAPLPSGHGIPEFDSLVKCINGYS